jgi:hypothetical protein
MINRGHITFATSGARVVRVLRLSDAEPNDDARWCHGRAAEHTEANPLKAASGGKRAYRAEVNPAAGLPAEPLPVAEISM